MDAKAWCPTLWEEHNLRKILGSTKEEITGDGRKLHNEELKDLCCLPMVSIFQLQEAGIYITFSLEICCRFRISLASYKIPSNNVIKR